MKPIIEVSNISKCYSIGAKEAYGSLREEIMQAITSPFRRTRRNKDEEPFWALKDVSFDVNEGDVLGVIGRNGAGKSTLLKILSRITEPTSGRIVLRGRVASLLEVGTGFHPELTGRENIYLNGALLGMTSREIKAKFDEIVAFSEIEKFLDTPVKRYSSGMYVRLAFAVAAHLEPEILIIDEVLAVGDAEFQKKCLGKMGDVAKGGRTVIFVSHNMGAVSKLCSRGVLLENGKAVSGPIGNILDKYLNPTNPVAEGNESESPVQIKKELSVKSRIDFKIENIRVTGPNDEPIIKIRTGDTIKLTVDYHAKEKLISPALIVSCKTEMGIEVFRLSPMPISGYHIKEIQGQGLFDLIINKLPLVGGIYYFDIGLGRANMEWYFNIEKAVRLKIEPTDFYGSGLELDNKRGLIAVSHKWNHLFKRENK